MMSVAERNSSSVKPNLAHEGVQVPDKRDQDLPEAGILGAQPSPRSPPA